MRLRTTAAVAALLATGMFAGCDGRGDAVQGQSTYTYTPRGEGSAVPGQPTIRTHWFQKKPRLELSDEQIATLVFMTVKSPRRVPCPLAVARAGSIHTADQAVFKQAEDLDGWFERTIRANRGRYPLSEVKHKGDGWTGTGWKHLEEIFEYREAGRSMKFRASKTWGTTRARDENGILGEYPYKHIEVSFCAFVPDHVELLSVTGSGKGGPIEVQYRLVWSLTELAQLFQNAGVYRLELSNQPVETGSAMLRQSGPGSWAVDLPSAL